MSFPLSFWTKTEERSKALSSMIRPRSFTTKLNLESAIPSKEVSSKLPIKRTKNVTMTSKYLSTIKLKFKRLQATTSVKKSSLSTSPKSRISQDSKLTLSSMSCALLFNHVRAKKSRLKQVAQKAEKISWSPMLQAKPFVSPFGVKIVRNRASNSIQLLPSKKSKSENGTSKNHSNSALDLKSSKNC